MDNQEDNPKQNPTKLPDLTLFQQANSDIALAASQANSHFALPSSDSPLSMLSSDEDSSSEEEQSEEEEEEEEESNENFYEYNVDSNGIEDDFDEFLEDQESNIEEDEDNFLEEEDEIDPDELSYEELISLGEFIGVEKRGFGPTEISNCLSESTYKCSDDHKKKEIDRCVICQMEYEEGESMAVLKPCDHPYHIDCITKWLQTKKICPICCTEPFITSRTD